MNQPPAQPNPFIGPRPFREEEQLYGRERETGQLFNLVLAERVVLLYSPSGAGKTSLLRASLIPRLRGRRFSVLPMLRVNLAPNPAYPAANRYLYSVLTDLEEAYPEAQRLPEAELAAMRLSAYLDARTPSRSVLIFDQFEEILTLDPTDTEAKQEFFNQVGEALQEPSRFAVFAMREDYLAGLEPYLRPLPNRLKATFRLDLLGKAAAQEVVERTAHQGGVDFSPEAAARLVEDLSRVQVMQPDGNLSAVTGAYVEPVQLQVVGYNLWQKLRIDQTAITLDELDEIGNVDISLAEYYAARVRSVAQTTGEGERWIRRWFERKLITESGIRGQVLMEPEVSGGLSNAAIRLLEDAHLVRRDTRRGTTWFELTHDRLLNPVQQDNTAWFNTNLSLLQRQAELWRDQGLRDDLLLRDKALLEVEAWADTHATELSELEGDFLKKCRAVRKQEQQRLEKERIQRRRLQIYTTIAVAAAAIAFVLVFIAVAANRKANAARVEADNNANKARAAEQSALEARDEAEAQRKEAELQRRQAEQSADAAKRERAAAEYEQGMARAGELAAEARLASPAYPQRSLLLAVEAARSAQLYNDRHPATLQALMQGLSLAGGTAEGSTYQEIFDMNISPTGRWLAVDYETVQRFYDLDTGQPELLPWAPEKSLGSAGELFFSPSERWLFDSSSFRLYDLEAPDPLEVPVLDLGVQPGANPDSIRSVLFIDSLAGSDSEWLAILMPNELWLVDLDEPKLPIRRISIAGAPSSFGLRASPPNKQGVSRWLWLRQFGLSDAGTFLLDLEAAQKDQPALVELPEDPCSSPLDFSTDGSRLYALDPQDNRLCYWDLAAGSFPTVDTRLDGLVYYSYYANDVGRIAAGQDTGRAGPFSQSRISRGLPNVLQEQEGRWLTWNLSSAKPALANDSPLPPPLPAEAGEHPFSPIRLRSPDGRWLFDARGDQAVLHDLFGWLPAGSFKLEDYSYIDVPRRFSPDGRWLLAGCFDSQACLYDLGRENPGQNPIVLGGHESWIGLYAFDQGGNRLVTASADTSIRLWNLYRKGFSDSPLHLGQVPNDSNFPILAISPNSRWLFYDHTLWDLAPVSRGQDPDEVVIPNTSALVAAFSPDSRWLVVATRPGWSMAEAAGAEVADLYLWDLQAQMDIFEKGPLVLTSQTFNTIGLAFSPDSNWLADSSGNLWYLLEVSRIDATQASKSIPPGRVGFTADSTALTVIDDKGQVTWLPLDPALAGKEMFLDAISGQARAISPDGRLLVTQESTSYLLWELDGEQTRQLKWNWPVAKEEAVQFSPDSRYLAIGNSDTFTLLDLSAGEPQPVTPAAANTDQASGSAMLFGSTGKWLINNNYSNEDVSLFGSLALPLYTNRPLVSQSGAGLGFAPIGFGGGGGGSSGGIGLDIQTFRSAYLWPVDSLFKDPATTPVALGGHSGEIQTFLISPDESWSVTLSNSRQLRLWDLLPAAQGEALQPVLLPETESAVKALGFTPDSRWLATADDEGRVDLWLLDPGRLETAACQAAGRNLTLTEWQRFFPNEPYHKTCADLPLHNTVADNTEADMRQLAQRGEIALALRRYRQLLEQEPTLPPRSIDWKPVCMEAIRRDQYDLVRSECQAAGVDEKQLQAAYQLETAQALIAKGEFTAAVELLQQAKKTDPELEIPKALLCGQAAAAGRYAEVQSACDAWEYNEQIARMTYWYIQFSDFYYSGRYREAAELLSASFREDPVFKGYMSVYLPMVGNLCNITYQTGDGYDLIEDYCQTAIYKNMYFRVYLLLEDARAKLQAGNIKEAIAGLDQAAGEQSRSSFGDPFQDICTLAAQLNEVEGYREYCLRAGIDLDLLQQELLDSEYNQQLTDLVRAGGFSSAAALLASPPQGGVADYDTLRYLCLEAATAGQYSLVEAACAASGFDPAQLELEDMIARMESLLYQRRIDDALLSFNKILLRFPESRVPESAWQNLCAYGVAAGQYYKVKDACMRVPQPEG